MLYTKKGAAYKGTYDPVVPIFYDRYHSESHLSLETGSTTRKILNADNTQ